MRTKLNRRKLRPAYVVGLFTLAIPASALALSAGQSPAQSAPQFTLAPHRLDYGGKVTVRGALPAADKGRRLELAYQQPGRDWRAIGYTTVRRDGRFRFVSRLWRSGLIRVLGAGGSSTQPVGQGLATPAGTSSSLGASAPKTVAVAARVKVRHRPINVLGGRTVSVRGHLLPGIAGRSVQLQGRSGGRWHTLASARTGSAGRFDLRFRPKRLGSRLLRVRFAGDAGNARTVARSAMLTVYHRSVASWYYDAGSTACGFHATMGVANKTLPCGTRVEFFLGGRKVTAIVDDRGPFVAGRNWDLNQNTAGALGVSGVATLWSSR